MKYELKQDPYEVEHARNLNTQSGQRKFTDVINPYMMPNTNNRPILIVKRSHSQSDKKVPRANDDVKVENAIPFTYQTNPYLYARQMKESNLNGCYSSFYDKHKSM